jgi:DNA-binding response OmpR family regulator
MANGKWRARAFCVIHAGMNILVVEDDPRIGDVLVYALRNEGHSVRIVSRGNEALTLAAQVDFVVLDVGLPDLDGFEVCRRIRGMQHLQRVPVAFITANRTTADLMRAKEVGGNDFIIKPFEIPRLQERIRHGVARRLP